MGSCEEEISKILRVAEMLQSGFKFISVDDEMTSTLLNVVTIEEGRQFALGVELKEIVARIKEKMDDM